MRKLLLLAVVMGIPITGLCAPAKVNVDTKTRAVTADDGINTMDYKAVTLTLGDVTISDTAGIRTINLGSTNGTKIGATGNKIGFLGATTIVRPSSTTDLRQALINLGLYTTGGATPLNLNGGAFTTTGAISGVNETLSGTLGVTGNTTLGGTLGVTGAFTGTSMTLSGNEIVNGNQTVAGSSTLHAISGTNETLSGTLGVTGLTTLAGVNATNGAFSGTLGVTGTSTLGVLNASNGAFSGTLGVTGTTTLGLLNAVNGDFEGNFNVDGDTTLTTLNATTGTFSTDLNVGGASDFTGNAAFGNDITVDGTATVAGVLAADSGSFANGLSVIGPSGLRNTTVTGTLGVTGALSGTSAAFSGNETVGGTLGVTGATTGSTASYSSTVRGQVQDKGGAVYNVKAYGAVGDDSTDNTAFINATIAAAGARPVLFFPAGIYRTDFITWPSDCTIIGNGNGSTIIKVKNGASGASSNLLFYFPDANSHLTIRDLTLDGNRGNQVTPTASGSNAILFIGGDNVFVENVEITHSEATGSFVGSNVGTDDVTFKNCHIHDNGGTVNNAGIGIGIFSGGSVTPTNITIDGGTIENNHNTITRPNDSTGVNLQVSGVTIKGVTFKNNYNVAGAQLAVTDSGDGTGIVNAAITGNTIIKTGTFGSPVDDTIGIEVNGRIFAITGNIINGFTTNGINIEAAGGYGTITGNTLYNGPYAIRLFGLTTDTVSNIAITGNQFRTTTCGILYNNLNTYISTGINENTTAASPVLVTGGSLSATNSSQVIGGLDVTGNLTAGNLVPQYQVTQTLSSTGGFSFTSIPGTYHELSITISGRGTVAATSVTLSMTFNNDTGANYEWVEFGGSTQTSQTSFRAGVIAAATGPANYPGIITVSIPAYSGTTHYKGFSSLNVYSATAGTLIPLNEFGIWKSIAAINRVDGFAAAAGLATGSTATLTAR